MIAIQGVTRDITARKRAEAALQKLQTRLCQAVEMAYLGYWEQDVAEGVFSFDDAFYRIFRTTAEAVGGYTMTPEAYASRFLYPEDRPTVAEETQKAIATEDTEYNRQLEHRIRYADGTQGYIAVRIFVVKDDQGRTIKTYGVNQDITERRRAGAERERLHAQLLQAQKMDTVGRLAGGVAHDFNNMLAVILGYTEFAMGEADPAQPIFFRLQERMPQLKTLFISDYTAEVITRQGFLQEGLHFVQKPFSRKELEARVHQALRAEKGPVVPLCRFLYRGSTWFIRSFWPDTP